MSGLLFDCTHTSHCRANSGVQRVVRSLYNSLEGRMERHAILFDHYEGKWRQPDKLEETLLTWKNNTRKVRSGRGAKWGFLRRQKSKVRGMGLWPASDINCVADSFITAEIFSDNTRKALPKLFEKISGPKVAVFHDAIAVKFPGWYKSDTVENYGRYMLALAEFDAVLAVSKCSKNDLELFWKEKGVMDPPPVSVIPLGVDGPQFPKSKADKKSNSSRPIALFVSTFETRKNHLELLEACSNLWREGIDFELRLVGGTQKYSGRPIEKAVEEARETGLPVFWEGAVSEERLNECYSEAAFVVYPSLYEGFGLPVIEAMKRGKPVVMTNSGALEELSGDGGCLVSQGTDATSLAETIREMIISPDLLEKLEREAVQRSFPDWNDTAGFLKDFICNEALSTNVRQ